MILRNSSTTINYSYLKNRNVYYDNLTAVRTKNELDQWLAFFLVGVFQTAENSIQTFHSIIKLRKEVEEDKLTRLGKRVPMAMRLVHYLYSNPIVDAGMIAREMQVNVVTAHRLVQDFEKLGILVEQTGYKRNRIFVFEQYLELFR